jgi:hypothetical protein
VIVAANLIVDLQRSHTALKVEVNDGWLPLVQAIRRVSMSSRRSSESKMLQFSRDVLGYKQADLDEAETEEDSDVGLESEDGVADEEESFASLSTATRDRGRERTVSKKSDTNIKDLNGPDSSDQPFHEPPTKYTKKETSRGVSGGLWRKSARKDHKTKSSEERDVDSGAGREQHDPLLLSKTSSSVRGREGSNTHTRTSESSVHTAMPWGISPIERGLTQTPTSITRRHTDADTQTQTQTPTSISRSLSLVHPSVRAKIVELWVSAQARCAHVFKV